MSSKHNIADLRKSYEKGELTEAKASANPFEQFDLWLREAIAAKVPEPNAMTLATVSALQRPSTRVVLVKGYDERGLVWYTNYGSRKGIELEGNSWAALQFHWVEMERVVRLEGKVEKISAEESDAYYISRPIGSRIGAWASPQSEVIKGRDVLEKSWAEQEKKAGNNPARPANWGGYRLVPEVWEFWQGRRSRLHDRLRYRKVKGSWVKERLAP